MSTRIGTLQPQARLGHPARLAGLLAAFVAATLAFAVISSVRDGSEDAPVGEVVGIEANTPSELNGGMVRHGIAGGTFANTPSEPSGGGVGGSVAARVADIQARRAEAAVTAYERAWRAAQLTGFPYSVTGIQDPQEPIVVNGNLCRQCR